MKDHLNRIVRRDLQEAKSIAARSRTHLHDVGFPDKLSRWIGRDVGSVGNKQLHKQIINRWHDSYKRAIHEISYHLCAA